MTIWKSAIFESSAGMGTHVQKAPVSGGLVTEKLLDVVFQLLLPPFLSLSIPQAKAFAAPFVAVVAAAPPIPLGAGRGEGLPLGAGVLATKGS